MRATACVVVALLAALGAHGARVDEAGQHQAMAMQSGDMFVGRYQLLSLLHTAAWPRDLAGFNKVSYLGKGAFGETWLAYDSARKQNVAVKFFYRSTANGGIMLLNKNNANRGEKEQLSEAGMECDTPTKIINAKAFPAGQDRFARCLDNKVNDSKYAHLVLEVAGSENLEEYLARLRPASATIQRIAKMMLEGLAQMEGKFVHRDIKPANIMVYEDGDDKQLYLRYIDFGLVVQEGTNSGVAGTPMFLPPEMWPVVPSRAKMTYSFDVYSTGETLYQLMCGKTFHEYIFDNFGHMGERQIAAALQTNDPRRYCTPSSTLKPLFDLVVGKMMAGSPGSRVAASKLLENSVFKGISTTKKVNVQTNQGHKPNRKPAPKPVVNPPPKAKPVEPTFLDKCHAAKRFWFENAVACCLKEKYDPRRQAFCARPCGPNVPYEGGQCKNNCKMTSGGAFTFNKELSCCVSQVWKSKCIYSDHMPRGDGWGWEK